MHVKEICYIYSFDHWFKQEKRGKGVNFICEFYSWINVMFRQYKEKNKNLLRLKLKSALKIEQISVVL
jgi:hypothetical protein